MIDPRIVIRSSHVCVVLLSVLALPACGGPAFQPLLLSDQVMMPSARVSRALYRADRSLSPSDVQTEIAVEGGLLGVSGSAPNFLFTQALIGNQAFTSPQHIDTEFDFRAVDASMHWRHAVFNRRIGYDLFGGVAWTDFDFLASSTVQAVQARESISSPALRLGAGAFLRVYGGTSVEVQGTLLQGNHNFEFMGGRRFSLVQKLGRHATVNGGFYFWHVETSNSTRSRIEVDLQGLTGGVNLKF